MKQMKQNRKDRAYIFFVMFAVFFVVLAVLAGKSFGQDLVLIDSVKVPIVETYDTICACYPESLVVYSWLDSGGEAEDTIVAQFGYTRFGNRVWTTTIILADSAGSWTLNPIIMHHLDPYDVNRDGRVSISDIAPLIWRLFIR